MLLAIAVTTINSLTHQYSTINSSYMNQIIYLLC